PADKIDKLFGRFEQVEDEDLARRRRGTGLGLAICRSLVELHDGHIWIESTLGEGSNFQFRLPVMEPPQPDNAEAEEVAETESE
ncbi:MAG: ATP-binding protein, partial [Anaerolineae bacterium]|nr:ATP-binding protein [Anaerolineae bacterium]